MSVVNRQNANCHQSADGDRYKLQEEVAQVVEQSMGALLAHSYKRYAARPAIVGEGQKNFADLEQRVRRVANALVALGVNQGDRVVILLENTAEFLEIEQAIFVAGYVRTALSPRLHVREVVDIVNDCTASVVVTDAGRAAELTGSRRDMPSLSLVVGVGEADQDGVVSYADLLASTPPDPPPLTTPKGEDVAVLLYTSGTTGRPKAAMLTHHNWTAMVRNLMAELPLIDDTDVLLHAAPMSHLSGSIGSAYYLRGAAIATMRRFDPVKVLHLVQELRVTVLPVVPTMLASLTAAAKVEQFDLSSLRAIPYGGSAVSPETLLRAAAIFGEVLVQVYGLSEALVPLTALPPSGHRSIPEQPPPARLMSAGRPTPFVELRIVQEDGSESSSGQLGDIHVRGDSVMLGYWNRPDATAEMITQEGWARTGDVGYLDENGYLYIVDRKRDVIVSGGFNIYPAEVERAIVSLPEVDEVVVIGTPHRHWGETVTAVITLRIGCQLTSEQVIGVCQEHLASYKKPTKVEFVDKLPKTSSGKLLRREVRARYWAGHGRQVGQ